MERSYCAPGEPLDWLLRFVPTQSSKPKGEGRRDLGTESYRVRLGSKDVPLGIENAMLGMKRGERRSVELPPAVGFETSDWNPAPQTRRGKATVVGYRQILTGNGSTQPPFPAETIWDIEVVRIRSPTSALPPPGS